MDRAVVGEDVVFILYLAPMIVSAVYAIVIAGSAGLSILSRDVYLTVTKSGAVFLVGFSAVCASILLNLYLTAPEGRAKALGEGSSRVQKLAAACVILAALAAWGATGFSPDLGEYVGMFLEGRYAFIFPLLLMAFSVFLRAGWATKVGARGFVLEVLPVILAAGAPLALYALWRVEAPWAGSVALTFTMLALAVALFVYRRPDSSA